VRGGQPFLGSLQGQFVLCLARLQRLLVSRPARLEVPLVCCCECALARFKGELMLCLARFGRRAHGPVVLRGGTLDQGLLLVLETGC
jgi:hypothetical protein